MLYRALLLALSGAHAWNDCDFPEIGYYAVDESIGLSFAYGADGMNGKLYTGGYYQGNFALTGVTKDVPIPPEPCETLWGDVNSNVQNLYLAETDATGKMTKTWSFSGTGVQVGSPGHGKIVNRVQVDGVKSMLDDKHLAVKGDFSGQMTLREGMTWSAPYHSNGEARLQDTTKFNVQFVMKLDVSKDQGIGFGTTGWARVLDEDLDGTVLHPGGVDSKYVTDVAGDKSGNMILTYTGYEGYNATTSKMTGPTSYIMKLNADDGSQIWREIVPKPLRHCTPNDAGDIYCGYTMSESDGIVDFGDGVIMPAVSSSTAGIVKFDKDGKAVWAKPATSDTFAYPANFRHLALTPNDQVLAITGSGAEKDVLSRIDTSTGAVMWSDTGSGGGPHGFRGVEVSSDGAQVTTFGQIVVEDAEKVLSPLTLEDSKGSKTTVTSRGSYTVWVAAYNAEDGTGMWAIDGGSDGLDYFFAMGLDRGTNDIYVGGGVYDTPDKYNWGEVTRFNAMRHDSPSRNAPVGTTKAFTAKITSTTEPAYCLNKDTCSPVMGVQESDVLPEYCYIDRHCYKAGEYAPYPGRHCMTCDPTVPNGKRAWTPPSTMPDTSKWCFINDKCIDEGDREPVKIGERVWRGQVYPIFTDDPCSVCKPSSSKTSYTEIANGCMLSDDLTDFNAGCYDDKGNETMSEDALNTLMAEEVALSLTVEAQQAEMTEQDTVISSLRTENIELQADLDAAGSCKDASEKTPTWAIAMIAVVGAMFLLVFLTLVVLVKREQEGKPIFMPLGKIENM